MLKVQAMPYGLSIIYFNNENKNIYAKLPPDKEQAKKLSNRIYKDAMTALSGEQVSDKPLALTCD